jgi:hypothetical protein
MPDLWTSKGTEAYETAHTRLRFRELAVTMKLSLWVNKICSVGKDYVMFNVLDTRELVSSENKLLGLSRHSLHSIHSYSSNVSSTDTSMASSRIGWR